MTHPEIVRRALKRLDELECAALSAAPQQGPSDEELHDCKNLAVGEYLRSLAGTNTVIFSAKELMNAQAVGLRAVLARYGSQPAPVPVAERLPEIRTAVMQILNQARCLETRSVGNGELADRIMDAVSRLALPEAQP